MARAFFWLFCIYLAAYGPALVILMIGVYGLFGQQPDPISGLGVVMLGWPWTRFVDALPEAAWPFATALAPALNAGILFTLWRLTRP